MCAGRCNGIGYAVMLRLLCLVAFLLGGGIEAIDADDRVDAPSYDAACDSWIARGAAPDSGMSLLGGASWLQPTALLPQQNPRLTSACRWRAVGLVHKACLHRQLATIRLLL